MNFQFHPIGFPPKPKVIPTGIGPGEFTDLSFTGNLFHKPDIKIGLVDYDSVTITKYLTFLNLSGELNELFFDLPATPYDGQTFKIVTNWRVKLFTMSGTVYNVTGIPLSLIPSTPFIITYSEYAASWLADIVSPPVDFVETADLTLGDYAQANPCSIIRVTAAHITNAINLTIPSYIPGGETVIINEDAAITAKLGNAYGSQPVDPLGALITSVGAGKSLILKSVNATWCKVGGIP